MAIFRCSMFGHVVYDDTLTYQELLDTEARVTAVMQNALEERGAEHIDFTPQADALLLECLFPDLDRDLGRTLCDAVIRQLGSGVLARFLFVDRGMDSVVFYFLGRGKWREQPLNVPAPREALSGWVVRQERQAVQPRHAPETGKRTQAEAAVPETPAVELDASRGAAASRKRSPRKSGTNR